MEFHPLLAKPVSAPQPVGSTAVCINYNSDARLLKSYKIKILPFKFASWEGNVSRQWLFSPDFGETCFIYLFFSYSSSSWHLLMWVYVSHFYNFIIGMMQSRLEQLAVGERDKTLISPEWVTRDVHECVCVCTCVYIDTFTGNELTAGAGLASLSASPLCLWAWWTYVSVFNHNAQRPLVKHTHIENLH